VSSSIRVTQFQRFAVGGNFSVERLFRDVRAALPADIDVDVHINRYPSRGILKRITDAVLARRQCGRVNHILGDVHYLAWFLPRRGTLLTVLDCVSLERLTGARRHLFWFLWYWWPMQRAEHVTVISEYTRQSLLEWVKYPVARIHVIPPPLSAEFVPSPLPRNEHFRLLHIGTKPNKNLLRVCEAVQGLRLTLVIIGHLNEEQRALLTRLELRYENHVDLGPEQLVEQYRQADALVFASTYEGFGLPIIEAQAVGRPVVTSNACSMPEAAGGAACLVDPMDVSDIRRGIRRVMDDGSYVTQLIELGRANAARYTPESIAKRYAELYRTLHAE
jgi:glycosyltransferase involved in cell wall biosynthesis